MAVQLSGLNYLRVGDAVQLLPNRTRATIMTWIQTANIAQVGPGLFAYVSLATTPETILIGQSFSYANPGTLNPGRLAATIGTDPGPTRTYWERTAQIPGNALLNYMTVYDGLAIATNPTRFRSYLNGIEDTANGAFVGGPPGGSLVGGAAVDGRRIQVGRLIDDLGADNRYTGCVCMAALWRDAALTPAQAAEIFALGPAGDLSLSTAGLPLLWYRFIAGALTNSGSTGAVNNLGSVGGAPLADCNGGAGCTSGLLPAPLDTDFLLSIRRRAP